MEARADEFLVYRHETAVPFVPIGFSAKCVSRGILTTSVEAFFTDRSGLTPGGYK